MNIEEIKNRIYEAEGLLELAGLRPEKLSSLLPLVKERIREVNEGLSSLMENLPAKEEEIPIDTEEETEESEEQVELPADEAEELEEEEEIDLEEEEMETEEEDLEEPDDEEIPAAPLRTAPSFCLNDRFRFRRAIFGGSDDDFKAAMDHLATLRTFDEAEDLFFNDLNLDPEDPDVIDFMTIIKQQFEA